MRERATGALASPDDWLTPTGSEQLDSRGLRDAFACFPSGVIALCALAQDGVPAGMVVSSFTTVSLDPPLVSVSVQNTSTTWPILRERARLGLSVLAEQQHREVRQLASTGTDRFAGVSWRAADDGAVYLDDAVGWFSCSVWNQLPAGDHTIALLEIRGLRTVAGGAPLVFHASRFRRLAPGDQSA
ncbi:MULTISPECIES: flavin reductase family protein [Streptomyces]|jgi:flavin reductase (DIM6/NTAB) family NADH-FMN oxidoreductase RutF|uniref:flavin reductase family protein n=1 Tax=Streptomyces TaxID=1883 RepID=UPI0033225CC1